MGNCSAQPPVREELIVGVDGSDVELSKESPDEVLHEREGKHSEPECIGETIYALAIASFIRDYVYYFLGKSDHNLRIVRILYSWFMVLGLLGLQFFLLQAIYGLLCESAVNRIRVAYSDYELLVYGKEHVRLLSTGHYRGVGYEFLNATNFHSLSNSDKHNVCQIPLAHPRYLFAVLSIWTLTCVADFKVILDHFTAILWLTPTVDTLHDVIIKHDDGNVVVAGLTTTLKVILTAFCLLPRMISVLLLSFLGCKWLMATNSLSDVLLNTLALEFMLMLKSLLYETMATKRSKQIARTTLVHLPGPGHMTFLTIVGSLGWLLVVVTWVYFYIFHFQQVLPEYNWDVREVCATWDGAVHIPSLFR